MGKWVLSLLTGSLLVCGCISHEETVYRDSSRLKVDFENDAAGRIFYETLSLEKSNPDARMAKTSVSIPVVFEHNKKVVSGENEHFNNAVRRCDTNQDGKITEQEARIFAASLKKK